ncbi:ATP-dependent metallopeptidase FtsH/Yme1/Tma family protein [Prochlorococcus sp. MIT 1223]|uniref:ATP-dependent metallopeptidase FtsH/Yme1/Tma family protein n=1 Tax=Prochlorococcus sp. MIT 1223 TaxID=3096217 RepID=UPI002A750D16|nr:AAA family ATPase [Prochlorococcus sp. MIT 1223]
MYDSYSQLLKDISSNNIESIILIPKRREVLVIYKNGTKNIVSILNNDQTILRETKLNAVPLVVNDLKSEQAYANFVSSTGSILIFLIGFFLIINRTAKSLSSTFRFFNKIRTPIPEENLQTNFDDVAGLKEIKSELTEILGFISNPEKLSKLGARTPKGIMLIGSPGTGKTHLARALAGEAKVPFFNISAAEFVEMFVGIGASRIKELFKQAKTKSPCIIFIDEIDSIARKRGFGTGIGNDEREQTLNQLLTEMDGFNDNSGVLVLAATNRADTLDPAFTRAGRFDKKLFLSLPDSNERLEILMLHSLSYPISDEVSLEDWPAKTTGFSGAEIRNLLNEAAIIAAQSKDLEVKNNHLVLAHQKLTTGTSNSYINDRKKLLISYRNASKALVSFILSHPDKINRITLFSRSGNGDAIFVNKSDDMDKELISKSYLLSKVKILLAPRATELIIFGPKELTQISSLDLSEVYILLRNIIEKFGLSNLGNLYIDRPKEKSILQSLSRNKTFYSQSLTKKIDNEIQSLAKSLLEEVKMIITLNRKTLDLLVNELLDKEIIPSELFYDLMSKNNVENV